MADEKEKYRKTKTSMFALVQAGKEEAKKVQNIKSVSSQQTSEEKIPGSIAGSATRNQRAEPASVGVPIPEEVIQESEEKTEEPSELPKASSPKGLSMLFVT